MAAQIINTPGTKPIDKVTSIAREIEAWALDELGIVMSHFYGSTTWPDHSNRRCLDIMIAGPKGLQPAWATTGKPLSAAECKRFGDQVHDYVQANAKRFGANGLIWNRRVTGFPHVSNPPYRGPYAVARTYTGKSPHTDHNHLEVDSAAYIPPKKKPASPAPAAPSDGYATPKTRVVYVDKIKPGQKDSDSVYWLQVAFGMTPTGTYDAKTEQRAADFQRALGDDVDGDLGPLQVRALFRLHDVLKVRVEESSK